MTYLTLSEIYIRVFSWDSLRCLRSPKQYLTTTLIFFKSLRSTQVFHSISLSHLKCLTGPFKLPKGHFKFVRGHLLVYQVSIILDSTLGIFLVLLVVNQRFSQLSSGVSHP